MRALSVLAWLGILLPCSGADWMRVRTPQTEILTDAGEKAGRDTLARLEEIRGILAPRDTDPLPLRVFLFSSENEFRRYTDNAVTGGFYQSSPDKDFIVLRSGAGLPRAARHEYIHLILSRGAATLPLWFEEGTAELYSNTDFQRGRLIVGEPIPQHLSLVNVGRWLAANQLIQTSRRSPLYNEQALAGMFYAESWALVHMLNLAPGWREGMPRFAELLATGRDGNAAFSEAFGKGVDQALNELHGYVDRLRAVTLDNPARNQAESVTVERVSDSEAMLARADLALHVGHLELARELVMKVKRSRPDSPEGEVGLGALELSEDGKDAAREHLERAVALGSRDPVAYFQLAMLQRDAQAPRKSVDDLLKRAIDLDPQFGEAHFILGLEASDDGDFEMAIDHLRAATSSLPRRSYVWHALAFAQMKAGQTSEARLSAFRAERTAATPQEQSMAEALLESLR